jgi:hypothetical protein
MHTRLQVDEAGFLTPGRSWYRVPSNGRLRDRRSTETWARYFKLFGASVISVDTVCWFAVFWGRPNAERGRGND